MKRFILIIFTLFISYSAIAGSVSNKLPLGLVEQLYEMSLWQDSFDESGTVENIELNNFLNGLNALEADIPSYKVVDEAVFPSEIKIRAKQPGKFTNIDFIVRSVEFNTEINTSFSIPKGYKQIKL